MNWTYLDAANQTFTVDATALVELINNGTVTPARRRNNYSVKAAVRQGMEDRGSC